MRIRAMLIVLVVASVLLSSTLLASFAQVDDGAIPPLVNLSSESEDQAIDLSSAEMDDLEDVPLFVVTGTPQDDYLLLRAYDAYQDGRWTAMDDYRPYGGESISDLDAGPVGSLVIDPRADIIGNLPVPPTVDRVSSGSPMNLDVSYGMGTFRTGKVLTTNYTVEFVRYIPDAELLRDAEPGDAPIYLELPDDMSSEMIGLVDSIAQGSAYDRAADIIGYLADNMELNFTITPEGEDPVEQAVLVSGQGDAITITSSFVLMARSSGIPSRLCLGFQVDESKMWQTVRGSDLRAFAQILLDDVGWVRMDPVTIIAHSLDPNDFLYSGGNATLRGTLTRGQDILPPGGYAVLTDAEGGMWLESVDSEGVFEFSNMDAGPYTLGIGTPFNLDTVGERFMELSLLGGLNEVTVDCRSTDVHPDIQQDTNITLHVPQRWVSRDEPFLVTGWANTTDGVVDGATVQAYIPTGQDDLNPCGLGRVENGTFEFPCVFGGGAGQFTIWVRLMDDEAYVHSSDQTYVHVLDDTEIQILAPQRALPGSIENVTIRLVLASTGEGLGGAYIVQDGDVLLITNNIGSALVQMELPQEGDLHSSFVYAGSQDLWGSSAEVTIEGVIPELGSVEALLVRNGTGYVNGDVGSSKGPIDFERVWVEVDGHRFSGLTDDEGAFSVSINGTEPPLGRREVGVEVMGVSWQAEAYVKAITSMGVALNGTTAEAVLTDDLGVPLAYAEVEIRREQASELVTTDANGSFTVADLEPGLTHVIYDGDDTHLPTSTTIDLIIPGPEVFDASLLLAAAMLIAPLAMVSLILYRWRSSGGEEETVAPRRVSGPYLLGFPEIEGDLPPVWGSGEELQIQIPRDRSVSIMLDGELLPPVARDDGDGLIKLRLNEGWHVLEAVGPEGRSMESIEIVDYRRRIVELFNSNLDQWDEAYGPLPAGSTPREAVGALEHIGGEAMDGILDLFEEAEYSDHPVRRRNFVSMFRALEEVNP